MRGIHIPKELLDNALGKSHPQIWSSQPLLKRKQTAGTKVHQRPLRTTKGTRCTAYSAVVKYCFSHVLWMETVTRLQFGTRELCLEYTARNANYSSCKALFVVLLKRDKSNNYSEFSTGYFLRCGSWYQAKGVEVEKLGHCRSNHNFMISALTTIYVNAISISQSSVRQWKYQPYQCANNIADMEENITLETSPGNEWRPTWTRTWIPPFSGCRRRRTGYRHASRKDSGLTIRTTNRSEQGQSHSSTGDESYQVQSKDARTDRLQRVASRVLPEALRVELFERFLAGEWPWLRCAGSIVLRVDSLQVLHVLDSILQLLHILPPTALQFRKQHCWRLALDFSLSSPSTETELFSIR